MSVLLLLLLALHPAPGQEYPEPEECQEVPRYLAFLQEEVASAVERVLQVKQGRNRSRSSLQETLYSAKERPGQEGQEQTLSIAMEQVGRGQEIRRSGDQEIRQVLEVRSLLLGGISALRKGEEEECQGRGVGQQRQLGELRKEVMLLLLQVRATSCPPVFLPFDSSTLLLS